MPSTFSRHPRSLLFLVLAILATFLFLASRDAPHLPHVLFSPSDQLQRRVDRAETIYQGTVNKRKDFIRKLASTHSTVHMFPPGTEPWPDMVFWNLFPAAFTCPHTVERIGTLADGGKWVCGLERVERKQDCVVYSFGINGESSFEAEILSRTNGCELWGYDFSVKSFGPEITDDPALHHRAHFEPVGLAGKDAPDSEPKMYTLQSLMKRNGHDHIDILKIDIEGWEFDTLSALIRPYLSSGEPLPIGQMQLEIHATDKTFDEFRKWWEEFEAVGLRPFWTEPNLVYLNIVQKYNEDLAEYSFINIRDGNSFISDRSSYRPRGGSVRD